MSLLNKNVTITSTTEGVVLLDTVRGVYWHVNDTAVRVIEALERGRRLEAVGADIARDTGADPDQVLRDCARLLADLRRAHLIRRSG
ncbi:PqqD family peptide modification chaperone [uncultured Propionibacterium sp.]|uniref:PqqD family peptide modification chaperone n=1 Tax=uncultured Propionibacterium sp. TaxID=218066 RepID=UPI00292D65F9|nr:PqqD family peptide modification chaperone [uncultured Propionibacterium sp.]